MIEDKIKINIFKDEESLETFSKQMEFFNTKKSDFAKLYFFFKNFSFYLDERLINIDKLIKLLPKEPKEGSSTYFSIINSFKEFFERQKFLINQTNNMLKVDILEKYESKSNKMNEKIKNIISKLYSKSEEHQTIVNRITKSQEEFLYQACETCKSYQKLLEKEANIKSGARDKESLRKKTKTLQDDLDKKILDYRTCFKDCVKSRDDYIALKKECVQNFKDICSEVIVSIQGNIICCISQLLSNHSALKENLDKMLQFGEKAVDIEKDLKYFEEIKDSVEEYPKKIDFAKFSMDIEFKDEILNNNKINKDEIRDKLNTFIESINKA